MIRRLALGGQRVAWHDLTGRHLLLAPAQELDDPQIEARIGGEPASLVVAHNRRVLLLPGRPALWAPDPAAPGPGGSAYRALPLDSDGLRLWRAADGRRTLTAVADRAGVSVERARAFFARLTDIAVQAVQLRPAPPRPRDPALKRMLAPPRPAAARAPGLWQEGRTALGDYHRGIDDAASRFDLVETTINHCFGEPHPALGGRRYGEALADAFRARGWLGPELLEIGCGTGELAAAFLARSGLEPGRYTRLDASPALLAAQALRAPGTVGIEASAESLPFADRSIGLAFANEVIADLSAGPWEPDLGARFGLSPRPGLCNLGAWRLVAELARVLRPGGVAWLSEFGSPEEEPTETAQLDHPEVSIDFGSLAQVARAAGLRAELEPLPDFLGMDLGASWLARHSFAALRALDPGLPARAWTAASVPRPEPVEGLEDVPLRDEGPGPLPSRFWCISLFKD